MAPGIASGRAVLSSVSDPTLENSGQVAAPRVPIALAASEQATFPSAAFELSEKPFGRMVVDALICEGDGVVGLSSCGTLSSMSRPDGLSASAVVGCAVRLG